jgi:hypothetical protein
MKPCAAPELTRRGLFCWKARLCEQLSGTNEKSASRDGPQASRTTSIVTLRRAGVAASPSRSHSA